MKDWKTKFLESCLLGPQTDKFKADEVFSKCVELAYGDMMKAGRFYSASIKNNKAVICHNTKAMIKESGYVFSRELISKISFLFCNTESIWKGNGYVTRYGLAQKLVNMTFKYLYIFSDYINENMNFSICDCPLDSIILNKLPDNCYKWSKLTENQYEECQQIISKLLQSTELDTELKKLGNLAFDFLNW